MVDSGLKWRDQGVMVMYVGIEKTCAKASTKKHVPTSYDGNVEKSHSCKSLCSYLRGRNAVRQFREFVCRYALCRHDKGVSYGGSALRTFLIFQTSETMDHSDYTLS